MFELILPEFNLVLGAVFMVCALFLASNLIARTAKKLSQMEIGAVADLPVVISEEQRQANLTALMRGYEEPSAHSVLGSNEWQKRWEAIAATSGQSISGEVPAEVQLEASITRNELDAKQDTERTRKFYRDMEEALKDNQSIIAAEDEIQRRLEHEMKRHQLGKGSTVRFFSKKHGWREGKIVGFTTRRRARGRAIIKLKGSSVRIRRSLDKVEVC